MDLNHRPRPYQYSVIRSYKNLQVPRGLPKTAQVLQDHSNCGFNCGLKTSLFDRLRPGADCPHTAFGLALASSHRRGDRVWLDTSWPVGLGLVRVVNPGFVDHQVCGWPLWLWVKGRVMINRLLWSGASWNHFNESRPFGRMLCAPRRSRFCGLKA